MSIKLTHLFTQLMDQHGFGIRGGQTALALKILERDPSTTINRSRINMYCKGKYSLSCEVLKYIMMMGMNYTPDKAEEVINKYIALGALSELVVEKRSRDQLIDKIDEFMVSSQQNDQDFSFVHEGGARSTTSRHIPMFNSIADAFQNGSKPAWFLPHFPKLPYPPHERIGATCDMDTMRPFIHKGDLVLIHKESPVVLEHGRIYLFRIGDLYELKKVLKAAEGIYILSANGDIPDVSLSPENRDTYQVLGRVFFILKAA